MTTEPATGRRAKIIGVAAVACAIFGTAMITSQVVDNRSASSPTTAPSAVVSTAPSSTPSTIRPARRPTASPTIPASVPTDVTIPAIGVQTSILKLGLAADGTAEAPPFDRADEVGWYRYSPTPGQIGPAILIGHVNSPTGPAVFARLDALKTGDTVRVRRADGRTAIFTVTAVKLFPKAKFPTDLVYGDLDHAGLRLITCGGDYVRDRGGFQGNVVVFADLDHVEGP